MDGIEVDDWILRLLVPEEKVENKYIVPTFEGLSEWILTNKRIIRYQKSMSNKIFQDLDYKFIISIKLGEIRFYDRLFALVPIIIVWHFNFVY